MKHLGSQQWAGVILEKNGISLVLTIVTTTTEVDISGQQ